MSDWGFSFEVLNDANVRVTRRPRIEGELLGVDALIDIAHCALCGVSAARPNAVVRLLQSKVSYHTFRTIPDLFHTFFVFAGLSARDYVWRRIDARRMPQFAETTRVDTNAISLRTWTTEVYSRDAYKFS
jgi:hypothetical protein